MITHIAVLGAGTMGHGIAHAAVTAGFETSLFDPSCEALARGRSAIDAILTSGIERGTISEGDAQASRGRLKTVDRLERAVTHADLVIEAAPEHIETKLKLLRDVEKHAPARAVIASNTSALSLTEMAAVLHDPARFAGMHFFNPVHKMKLVEIVRALDSADATSWGWILGSACSSSSTARSARGSARARCSCSTSVPAGWVASPGAESMSISPPTRRRDFRPAGAPTGTPLTPVSES
jgi:3-hydroxyacyl-CoA dehydrogenase, NAD binding domain